MHRLASTCSRDGVFIRATAFTFRREELMKPQIFGMLLSYLALMPAAHASVTVEQAWVRATVPGQSVAAAYMKIHSSERGAALVSVQTPVAQSAEIHAMSMSGGVMKMRPLTRLELPGDRAVELTPGGYHLMLMNVAKPLKEGEQVPLTLTIERQDKTRLQIEVRAPVRSITSPGASHGRTH